MPRDTQHEAAIERRAERDTETARGGWNIHYEVNSRTGCTITWTASERPTLRFSNASMHGLAADVGTLRLFLAAMQAAVNEMTAINAALDAGREFDPAAYDAARSGERDHEHEWDTESESDVTYTPPPEFDEPKVIRCCCEMIGPPDARSICPALLIDGVVYEPGPFRAARSGEREGLVHFVSADVEDAGWEGSTACGGLPLSEPTNDPDCVTCLICLRRLVRAARSGEAEGGLRAPLQDLVDAVVLNVNKDEMQVELRKAQAALEHEQPEPLSEWGACIRCGKQDQNGTFVELLGTPTPDNPDGGSGDPICPECIAAAKPRQDQPVRPKGTCVSGLHLLGANCRCGKSRLVEDQPVDRASGEDARIGDALVSREHFEAAKPTPGSGAFSFTPEIPDADLTVDFGAPQPGSGEPMPPERRAEYQKRIKDASEGGGAEAAEIFVRDSAEHPAEGYLRENPDPPLQDGGERLKNLRPEDRALVEIVALEQSAEHDTRDREAAEAEVGRLREGLQTARRRVRQMHEAGFDSRRREIATDAICEIDTVLAPSPDDRGGER